MVVDNSTETCSLLDVTCTLFGSSISFCHNYTIPVLDCEKGRTTRLGVVCNADGDWVPEQVCEEESITSLNPITDINTVPADTTTTEPTRKMKNKGILLK